MYSTPSFFHLVGQLVLNRSQRRDPTWWTSEWIRTNILLAGHLPLIHAFVVQVVFKIPDGPKVNHYRGYKKSLPGRRSIRHGDEGQVYTLSVSGGCRRSRSSPPASSCQPVQNCGVSACTSTPPSLAAGNTYPPPGCRRRFLDGGVAPFEGRCPCGHITVKAI